MWHFSFVDISVLATFCFWWFLSPSWFLTPSWFVSSSLFWSPLKFLSPSWFFLLPDFCLLLNCSLLLDYLDHFDHLVWSGLNCRTTFKMGWGCNNQHCNQTNKYLPNYRASPDFFVVGPIGLFGERQYRPNRDS